MARIELRNGKGKLFINLEGLTHWETGYTNFRMLNDLRDFTDDNISDLELGLAFGAVKHAFDYGIRDIAALSGKNELQDECTYKLPDRSLIIAIIETGLDEYNHRLPIDHRLPR